ncbi:hypothetical protein [Cylindrospermopsis raciborskii]|uniref:hypothetical protein n=1 Tax=Cylindrospermopsis raciborskii TaxID=77022 RepID=UPI0022BD263D|nr:hypothetical protein [Cylindrospermopsis raciborskii]MCZ2207907.1 hypothetical protein [Cylindrospermopsis raciborskii PAMP2011]
MNIYLISRSQKHCPKVCHQPKKSPKWRNFAKSAHTDYVVHEQNSPQDQKLLDRRCLVLTKYQTHPNDVIGQELNEEVRVTVLRGVDVPSLAVQGFQEAMVRQII